MKSISILCSKQKGFRGLDPEAQRFGWSQKGMTLVELLFAVALIPILGMTLFGIMIASNRLSENASVYGLHNEAAMQALRTIGRELGQSSSLVSPERCDIDNSGIAGSSIITFQIPVDFDNDGDVVDATDRQTLEWGAYNDIGAVQDGILDGWVRYQLVAANDDELGNQLVRQVLDSGQDPIDGASKVLLSNVSTFTVAVSSGVATITLGVTSQNRAGQNQTADFEHQVTLRNSTTS